MIDSLIDMFQLKENEAIGILKSVKFDFDQGVK
jgi:hypothetical protein